MHKAFECSCPNAVTENHHFMSIVDWALILEKQCSQPQMLYIAEGQLLSSSSVLHMKEIFNLVVKQVISSEIGPCVIRVFNREHIILVHHLLLSIDSEMQALKVIITVQGRRWNYYVA